MAENVVTRGAVGAGGCKQSNGSKEEEEEEEERYTRIVVALLHQHDFYTTQYLEPG